MDIEGPEYSILANTNLLGCEGIRPVITLENSVHGINIADTTLEEFLSRSKAINYLLVDKYGRSRTEGERRKSGQTIFYCPEEKQKVVSTTITSFNSTDNTTTRK